jgi:capsular exopolysaccharide synthesis family protein
MRSSLTALPDTYFQPEESRGIELGQALSILWRRKLVLLIAFAILFTAGLGIVQLLPERYTGEVALILEMARTKAVDVKSADDQLMLDRAIINSEMDIFRSRGLMEQVVDKLALTDNPEFRPTSSHVNFPPALLEYLPSSLRNWLLERMPQEAVPADQLRPMVIDKVRSAVRVENENESNTVHLYVDAREPATAAAIANAVADLYLENDLRYRLGTTENAASWIKGKLDELRSQVTKADEAVQAFREQHQILDVDRRPLIDQQLAELSKQLANASATRMLRESELESIERARSGDGILSVAQIAASPLVQELRRQQNVLLASRAELGVKLGPRHPRVVQIETRLRAVQIRLDQEVAHVKEQAEKEAEVARDQESALTRQLDSMKQQREATDRASIMLRQLNSEATSARAMFDAFVQGLSRNAAAAGASESKARILSWAVPPLYPSFPPRNLLLVLTAVLAALLSVIVVAVVEFLDRGYRNPMDLERSYGIPVLGEIPFASIRGSGAHHPSISVIKRPASLFADAIQTVCTSLMSAQIGRDEKVVLVTSAIPGEGKTSLAIALGRFAARNGKSVLLIDCDLRHPNVAKSLGQESEHGLAELWQGRITIHQALHLDESSGLLFIPTVQGLSSPGEILGSEFMHKLVDQARRNFDLVLLDSPPVGIVSDAMVLSTIADATVMTVRWRRTPRSAVAAAIKRLSSMGRPARAAVFSHVNIKKSVQYSYANRRYFSQLAPPAHRSERA